MFGKRLDAFQALLVDDDDFARLDVADEFGVDQVQRARFAGQHPGVVQAADAQRPKAVRIAHADEFLFGHDDQRIGAFNAPDALEQIVLLAVPDWAGPSCAG